MTFVRSSLLGTINLADFKTHKKRNLSRDLGERTVMLRTNLRCLSKALDEQIKFVTVILSDVVSNLQQTASYH